MSAGQHGADSGGSAAAAPQPPTGDDSSPIPAQSGRYAPWKLLAWATFWSVVALAAALLLYLAIGLGWVLTGHADQLDKIGDSAEVFILATAVTLSLLAWIGVRNARKAAGGDLRAGLEFLPIRRPRRVALITGLMSLLGAALALSGVDPYPDLSQQILEMEPWLLGLACLLASIGSPIAAELFFRGWLWTALRRSWGVPATAFATGVLWYAMYVSEDLLYMAMMIGPAVGLTLIRHVGGSVRASILAHVAYNTSYTAIWLILAFVVKP